MSALPDRDAQEGPSLRLAVIEGGKGTIAPSVSAWFDSRRDRLFSGGRGLSKLADPNVELVGAAARGESRAQADLVRLYLPPVLAWCKRLGGPRIDAEDVAHDVMMLALKRLPSLDDPRAFNAWLYGIVRRELARHRRAAWVRRWTGGPPSRDVVDQASGPSEQAALRQLAARVQIVLEAMPLAQREVFVLCEVEERSASEVAELLAIPVGTVASRLRLARARFQETFRGEEVFQGARLASKRGAL